MRNVKGRVRLYATGIAIGVGSVIASNGFAAKPLITIYDSGDTLPIAPYMPEPTEPKDQSQQAAAPTNFPIRTDNMTPGEVAFRAVKLAHLQIPIFVIGNDERSRRWLVARREALKSVGAMGMLVNVDSEEQAKHIQRLGEGLSITAISGHDIAEQLKLYHYPALISKQAIEQ